MLLHGAAIVLGTAALVLVSYGAGRWLLGPEDGTDRKELAGSVLFRIAALHGLILSLVFAQQMGDYRELARNVAEEASAVADIYFDAARYGEGVRAALQPELSAYAAAVIEDEWVRLGETGRMSDEAWARWGAAYEAVLDLVPQTPRQEALRANMLARIHLVAEHRDARADHSLAPIGAMFWAAAIAGVVATALAYHVYAPTWRNLALMALFASFTGLVLFFIHAFSNPYAAPGALAPEAYERLVVRELG